LRVELVVLDADRDGYPERSPAWQCVGSAIQYQGRTYYDACVDPLGFCVPSYTLLAAADALGSEPNGAALAQAHRRAVAKPVVYYLDADGDGYGAGAPILVYPGAPLSSLWVRRTGDCNDANRLVHDWRPGLLPDCNANAMAESDQPQTICVGDAETFAWADERGAHSALRYRDAAGRFWIDEATARRSPDGSLLLEPPCPVTTTTDFRKEPTS
jgi:hypothetical protein